MGADKGFLRQIERILLVADNPANRTIDPRLIALHQLAIGCNLAGFGTCDQLCFIERRPHLHSSPTLHEIAATEPRIIPTLIHTE